jgi:hypothetical protein
MIADVGYEMELDSRDFSPDARYGSGNELPVCDTEKLGPSRVLRQFTAERIVTPRR